ncbi:hypothetical protein [Candidatus Halobonum tyrrellensis]|uniref:hypothetical protein n=1 Tax=Candidatus Halobonum tyrrellensis TaxID=1431545 RepID=UPI001267A2A7|nr:hypothetical protein [Candidatus Halobonum tyrrellensis]
MSEGDPTLLVTHTVGPDRGPTPRDAVRHPAHGGVDPRTVERLAVIVADDYGRFAADEELRNRVP